LSEPLLTNSNRIPAAQAKSNRGKIEIIGDILGVCLAGDAKRTHIMYRGNTEPRHVENLYRRASQQRAG
jgi:Predicted transcriptional regulator